MIPLNSFNAIRELPWYVVAFVFFTPLVFGVSLYFYRTRHAKTWRKGIFPAKLKFNQDNLLEAYLAIGARLILLDDQSSKGKTQFINQYFNRYFTKSNYNFGDSLLFSMKHPIQIKTVCNWLNEHLKDEGQRAQVIYFLTGLSLINGTLKTKELVLLKEMNMLLGLDENNLRRIIAIYQTYHQTKEENTSQQGKRKPSQDSIQSYRTILNVTESATEQEIKKAYRKLVKIHHPDAFVNASEAQKRMAEEKFIRIQQAYEGLTK